MEALELVRDTEPLLPGWYSPGDLPGGASDKEPTQETQGTWAQLLGREDPLEKGMAPPLGWCCRALQGADAFSRGKTWPRAP